MRGTVAGLLPIFACVAAQGQAASQAGSQDLSQTYTLRSSARSVITDVLVLDRAGKPVHGLPQSAFHLTDNGQAEPLASFEEHSGGPQIALAEDALSPGVYTNARLLHMPPVVNILVVDIANLSLPDQMYLAYQLEKLVGNLPAGIAVAMYLNAGLHSVLLQDFTADHTRLLDAVHHALPHFAALGRDHYTDLSTLRGIAEDFSGIPGRKNVLWFSGGAALSLNPAGLVSSPGPELRYIYDELEAGRIAVYPIDARGLTTAPAVSGPTPGHETLPDVTLPVTDLTSAQHGLMQDVATATGGLPYYNGNGVWQAALHDVETGGDFYTLSYSPHGLKFDNRFHRVRVEVDGGPYTFSYRQGYFADGANISTPNGARTRLLAGNQKQADDLFRQAQPIIFRAEVQPIGPGGLKPGEQPPAPGQTRYAIRYLVPGSAFARRKVGGDSEAVVGVGFIAMDRNGKSLLQHAKQVTFAVDEAKLKEQPNALVPIVQQVDLNRGDTYLSLLVWDATSRRVGTLNVPLQVPQSR